MVCKHMLTKVTLTFFFVFTNIGFNRLIFAMRIHTSIAALMLLAAGACLAAQPSLLCPPHLPTPQALGSDPSPWQVFDTQALESATASKKAGSHALAEMLVYRGHPSGQALLVPDEDKQVKGRVRQAWWQLAGKHWLGCTYANSSTRLIRPVPDTATACRIRYEIIGRSVKTHAFVCSAN